MEKLTASRSNGHAGPSPATKLALVESLVACDTPGEASELGVAWLARHRGVARVAIVLVDRERSDGARLVIAASHGLEASEIARLSVSVDDADHPLARAFASGRTKTLTGAAAGALGLTFASQSCTAYPLPPSPPRARRSAVGLVLVESAPRSRRSPPDAAIEWLLPVLGRRLADLVDLRVAVARAGTESRFLANMSHELRTPLNAILGYTSMLLQGISGPLDTAVTRQLTRVDTNGKHLLAIINDILDIARIEAGTMPLLVTRFPIGGLVEEVVTEVAPLVPREKLTVLTELGRSLPSVRSDRSRVKQILTNLVSNALKFTPSGTVTVSARLDEVASCLELAVADTGIGIAPADQRAVFQDFRQVDDSAARRHGGTGTGLALCRRLATHLGGDIRLVSAVGKGSTFTFVLPTRGRTVR